MLLLVALPFVLFWGCAPATAGQMSGQPVEPLVAARAVMHASGHCALITIGEDGRAQARTMDPSSPDERMRVLFVTNPASRKVAQLAQDDRVTLYYFDENSPGYVTLFGTARKIEESAEREKRWLEKWTVHYPEGPASAAMYEVVPSRIEVVSIAHGIIGDEVTWTPPVIELDPE